METTLRQESLFMDAATLGNPATLPPIFKENNFQAEKPIQLQEDDELYADQGKVPLMLPYEMQSMYKREMTKQEIPCFVLENRWMKAIFLRITADGSGHCMIKPPVGNCCIGTPVFKSPILRC